MTAPSEMKTCGPFKMDIAKILTSDESGSGVVVKVNLVLLVGVCSSHSTSYLLNSLSNIFCWVTI